MHCFPVARSRHLPAGRTDVLTDATLYRIWHIHGRLSRQEKVTAPQVAAELGCSARTIKRDLLRMADTLGMPVKWDEKRQTQYYTEPCAALPVLRLTRREAQAMALAAWTVRGSGQSSFARVFNDLIAKITPLLGGMVSMAAESVQQALSAPRDPAREAELEHLLNVLEAICDRRELRVSYQKPGEAPKSRTLRPLHLCELGGRWALLAQAAEGAPVKTHLLIRFRRVEETGRSFVRPADFDAGKYVRGALRRFAGEAIHEVRLALDAIAASKAREHSWHESQRLTEGADGREQMTLRVSSLIEVRNLVMPWAGHVEVLHPPELRTMMREAYAAGLAMHGGAGGRAPVES